MNLRVGNAPCSWGALEFDGVKGEQIGYERMLDELEGSGYTGTELGDWGYMPTDPDSLRAELKKRNLAMLGGFVPVALKNRSALSAGTQSALRVAKLMTQVGVADPKPFLVLADENGTVKERTLNAGHITPAMGLSASEWRVFANAANDIARAVYSETGLRTVFHHHCAGYVETPDEIERFLSLTHSSLLGLVFDTGHYTFAGGDVADGLTRFADRIWYLHFKDCDPSVAARSRAEGWDYFTSLKHQVFCELGRGAVDFPAAVRWINQTNYNGYVVVEQDILPGSGTPLESARRNREYLQSLEAAS